MGKMGKMYVCLFTWRPLTLQDVHTAAGLISPDLRVSGQDGDGTHVSITVETGRTVLVLKETSIDMDLEFADYLVAVTGSRQRPPFRYEPDMGERNDTIWMDHLAQDLLIRLAQVTGGVVADDLWRMLWPQNDSPPMRHDDEDEPEPPVRALAWRWYVRSSVCPAPGSAWMRVISRMMPQCLPSEYIGTARMMPLDEEGLRRVDAMIPQGREPVLCGPGPLGPFLVTLTPDPYGLYVADASIPLDSSVPINPLTVRSMLVEVGDELGAELGLAEVLDGWQWSRYSEPTSVTVGRGQRRQDLGLDGIVLAGLPIGPVWQVYLGPGYREVVDSVRFDEPPGWDSRSTRRGRLITLAPQPASMAEIATGWFPEELCMTFGRPRLLARRTLRPARVRYPVRAPEH